MTLALNYFQLLVFLFYSKQTFIQIFSLPTMAAGQISPVFPVFVACYFYHDELMGLPVVALTLFMIPLEREFPGMRNLVELIVKLD